MRRTVIVAWALLLGMTPLLFLGLKLRDHAAADAQKGHITKIRAGLGNTGKIVSMPECPDAPPRQANANPVTLGSDSFVDTDIVNTSLAEALTLLPTAKAPETLPGWVTCSVADVSLNQDGGGSVTVNFYEDSTSGSRAIQYQIIDDAPPFPPPCEACPPLGTWVVISGHPGFYEDSGATGGEATGHRIGWTDAAGHYLELGGAVTLDEAINIALSVPPT